ncbi:MAG: tetratricopeptide repeat protein [Raineya sp.]|jgi:tetratricopeptide (TPR) repeat protein|nr:tetratricopeptide repeat protein [Raineya sp.]
MKKQIFIPILLFFSLSSLYSQKKVDSLIEVGVTFHDKQEYDKAIEVYERVLKLAPNSALANYEMAFTYHYKKDYEKSLQYGNKVIKLNRDYLLKAYTLNIANLHFLDKNQECIILLKQAIQKLGDNYVFYHNLGIQYSILDNYNEAEKAFIKAITLEPKIADTHAVLGDLMLIKKKRIEALLCYYYYLMLQPNSDQSRLKYILLIKGLQGASEEDKNRPGMINVFLDPKELEGEFGQAAMLLNLLESNRAYKIKEGKSEEVIFLETTKLLFQMLKDMQKKRKEENKSLWWDFYVPFFVGTIESENIEAFCYYIGSGVNPKAREWIVNHWGGKTTKLIDWMKKN